MKSTKIIFLSITSIIIFFNSPFIKASQEPGFELYNKAPNPITVIFAIVNGTNKIEQVPSGSKFSQKINLESFIKLGIHSLPLATTHPDIFKPDYEYELDAPGKTKYLTWNPSKRPPFYPQTGVWMGLLGKSDSGYPLNNNITREQITIPRKKWDY